MLLRKRWQLYEKIMTERLPHTHACSMKWSDRGQRLSFLDFVYKIKVFFFSLCMQSQLKVQNIYANPVEVMKMRKSIHLILAHIRESCKINNDGIALPLQGNSHRKSTGCKSDGLCRQVKSV